MHNYILYIAHISFNLSNRLVLLHQHNTPRNFICSQLNIQPRSHALSTTFQSTSLRQIQTYRNITSFFYTRTTFTSTL